MKKRERRRYLTAKYQQKQVRLAYSTSYRKPYDPYRYLQRTYAIKARFIDELMGNIVGPEWTDAWRASHTSWMLGDPTELTVDRLGRFRRHSWTDCGRSRCPMCSNPRRGHSASGGKTQLTLAERKMLNQFDDDLKAYYKEGGK